MDAALPLFSKIVDSFDQEMLTFSRSGNDYATLRPDR